VPARGRVDVRIWFARDDVRAANVSEVVLDLASTFEQAE